MQGVADRIFFLFSERGYWQILQLEGLPGSPIDMSVPASEEQGLGLELTRLLGT